MDKEVWKDFGKLGETAMEQVMTTAYKAGFMHAMNKATEVLYKEVEGLEREVKEADEAVGLMQVESRCRLLKHLNTKFLEMAVNGPKVPKMTEEEDEDERAEAR